MFPVFPLTHEHPVCSSGDDDGGLLQSGDGRRDEGRRSVSPSDPVESLNAFTRKIGAFVNKPSTQVSSYYSPFLKIEVGTQYKRCQRTHCDLPH